MTGHTVTGHTVTGPRYGSLFAGYGGLDMGVQSVLGGSTAWHAETARGPAAILAHHWPGVPNLGDVTTADWDSAEPVDILTGGFPCQDVSTAGLRAGLRPGTRSGLWSHMAYAVARLRPRLVIAENVGGILSAAAHSNLEPCPWCLADGGGVPLRALGAVLGDLADIGYDADWYGVRASDAGAPHQRLRVFIYAHPADDRSGAADPTSDGRYERWTQPTGVGGGPDAPECGDAATDPGSERHGGVPHPGQLGPVDSRDASRAPQRERPRAEPVRPGQAAAPDTHHDGQRHDSLRTAAAGRGSAGPWGEYTAAVTRWEGLTRPAPPPTERDWRAWHDARARRLASTAPIGHRGSLRRFTKPPPAQLSPAFVEWMMGLPAGHVTDPAIGLTRSAQLTALGNGVVPQQAALATRLWLATSGSGP